LLLVSVVVGYTIIVGYSFEGHSGVITIDANSIGGSILTISRWLVLIGAPAAFLTIMVFI
jgi:hypothetical protein